MNQLFLVSFFFFWKIKRKYIKQKCIHLHLVTASAFASRLSQGPHPSVRSIMFIAHFAFRRLVLALTAKCYNRPSVSRLSASSFPEREKSSLSPPLSLHRGRHFYFPSRTWTLHYVGQSRWPATRALANAIGSTAIGSVRTQLSRPTPRASHSVYKGEKRERDVKEGSRITKSTASAAGASRRCKPSWHIYWKP